MFLKYVCENGNEYTSCICCTKSGNNVKVELIEKFTKFHSERMRNDVESQVGHINMQNNKIFFHIHRILS